jgi:hypothetical protein
MARIGAACATSIYYHDMVKSDTKKYETLALQLVAAHTEVLLPLYVNS